MRACVFFSVFLTLAGAAAAQPDSRAEPPDETRLLNRPLPDIGLTTAASERIALSTLSRTKPLVLGFVFTRCSGVCSPFLRSWRAADDGLSSFHRLVVSFDARDTVADMSALAGHVGASNDPNWTFAIAAPEDVTTRAEATGFWYEWDESRQQFDHPAMLAGIRDGRLVRLLVGGSITPVRLGELVREVSGEFVASYPLPGRVRFRCVQFDAATGRVALDWGFALLLIPVAATTVTTLVIFGATSRQSTDARSRLSARAATDGSSDSRRDPGSSTSRAERLPG
jgi:cytochrome oxidase Cu insertion factor (SCO1/SenC/PrrC family)